MNVVKLLNIFLKPAAVLCLTAAVTFGASPASLTMGKAELKSAGPLAFGPDGILFIGDSSGGAVHRILNRGACALVSTLAVRQPSLRFRV